MTGDLKISFVAASRNDDHGGNLLHRMQVFIEALLGQCDRHGLNAELVLVEWNPPQDRPGLAEALRRPRSENCRVRIVTVPPGLHRRFDNADSLPLHQMIAKNVGIRRSRGNFVVATNIDVLFSNGLMAALAQGDLDAACWYRTDRHDVPADIPASISVEDQLAYCAAHVIRVHGRDGTEDREAGTFNRIYRDPARLRATAALSPLSFLPVVGSRIRNAARSLEFIETCGRLHTNASGDFTCMARTKWHELRGYWEFTGFPAFVDGLLCHGAKFSGLEERILSADACIYHIEHGTGTGYAGYASGDKWKNLDIEKIPRITPENYRETAIGMARNHASAVRNGEDWGLANETLEETTPGNRQSSTTADQPAHGAARQPHNAKDGQ